MIVRRVAENDVDLLFKYLCELSPESRSRFGPHTFNRDTIKLICKGVFQNCLAYICEHNESIIAYTIVKKGYVEQEQFRFESYNFKMDLVNDYTLAPSVADAFQSKSIGSLVLNFIENDLKKSGAKKLVLWGGVQASNAIALNFYSKNGFETLGEFEYFGKNYDMVKYLNF